MRPVAVLLLLTACPQQKQAAPVDAAPTAVRSDAAPLAVTPGIDAAPAVENQPPELVELSAAAGDVAAGGTVTLQARAVDLEKDPLTFWWSASCGAVVRRHEDPARAIFVAPLAAGSCRVSVSVEDERHKGVERGLDLLVHAAGPEVAP